MNYYLKRANFVKDISSQMKTTKLSDKSTQNKLLSIGTNNTEDYPNEVKSLLKGFINDPTQLNQIVTILDNLNSEFLKELALNWQTYKPIFENLNGTVVSIKRITDLLENKLGDELSRKLALKLANEQTQSSSLLPNQSKPSTPTYSKEISPEKGPPVDYTIIANISNDFVQDILKKMVDVVTKQYFNKMVEIFGYLMTPNEKKILNTPSSMFAFGANEKDTIMKKYEKIIADRMLDYKNSDMNIIDYIIKNGNIQESSSAKTELDDIAFDIFSRPKYKELQNHIAIGIELMRGK